MKITTRTIRNRTLGVLGGAAIIVSSGAMIGAANADAATTSLPTVLQKIRYCESGGNYTAQNPTSSASGAYQFLTTTWQGLSASKGYATAASAPAAVQDAAALELYNQSGTSPWAASQSCWAGLTSVPGATSNTTGSGATATSVSRSTTRTADAQTTAPKPRHLAPQAKPEKRDATDRAPAAKALPGTHCADR